MTKFYYILISTILLLCTTYLLNAQERDPRTRTYISPARVVWQSDAGVRLSDVLLKPGNGQAYCNNDTPESYCIMKSGDGVHPVILLDYGKELHGGLQLVTDRSETLSKCVSAMENRQAKQCPRSAARAARRTTTQ